VDLESNEQSTLLGEEDATQTDAIFVPLLDRELNKIAAFYEHQEKELLEDLQELEKDVLLMDDIGLVGGGYYEDYTDDDDEDDDSVASPRTPDATRSRSRRRKSSSAGQARRTTRLSQTHLPPMLMLIVVTYLGVTNTSPDVHRRSVSSIEEPHDLEASYTSNKGPGAALGRLGTTFNNLRDSIVSSPSATEPTIWTAESRYAYDTRLLYKRRITNLYISFTNLKSYVEVNYSGFRKIMKK
jgi:phosphate transporter